MPPRASHFHGVAPMNNIVMGTKPSRKGLLGSFHMQATTVTKLQNSKQPATGQRKKKDPKHIHHRLAEQSRELGNKTISRCSTKF